MKLSNQQALMLLEILNETLPIVNGFGFGQRIRIDLYETIIKQQDTSPVDLQKETYSDNKKQFEKMKLIKGYEKLSELQMTQIEVIKERMNSLWIEMNNSLVEIDSNYLALCKNNLEQAAMWYTKSIVEG